MGLLIPALKSCYPPKKQVKVSIKGANSSRGHALRSKDLPFTKRVQRETETVIVGGGVSGLSCGYHLNKNGVKDLVILELADDVGGNSAGGRNSYSEYPYGAHYLTLPNGNNTPLLEFLHENGIITSFDQAGKPAYNETDLCLDPEERLFIKGVFQEGLIPTYTLSNFDREQIASFLKLTEDYKYRKGSDEKYFFDIPYSSASIDASLDGLDKISFARFIHENKYTSEYLLWYLDYCCRDDFGGGIDKISAWAGINYFASHRPVAANTDSSRVLTWPEGNKRLIEIFKKHLHAQIQTACLVKHVNIIDDKVTLEVIDFKNEQIVDYTCSTCVMATPPFANGYVLDQSLQYPQELAKGIKHVPWVTAAVTLSNIPPAGGMELCWDNVGYKTQSLGYIYDQHQDLSLKEENKVISLYIPLDKGDMAAERQKARQRTEEEWKQMVITELDLLHPGIESCIEEIEIWLWGHAMALPEPSLIKSGKLKTLAAPIQNRIFFAHTDLTGYSVFEEGFDWGYRTALQIKPATP